MVAAAAAQEIHVNNVNNLHTHTHIISVVRKYMEK
jgi:hypothetical protein